MPNYTDLTKPLWLLLKVYLLFVAVFAVGRFVFLLYFFDRVSNADHAVWWVFLYGLRLDTIVVSTFLLIPALLISFTPRFMAKPVTIIIVTFLLALFTLTIFMENATLPFINEYDVRPNVLFINYLETPDEVLGTIWAIFKLELFVAVLLMVMLGALFYRYVRPRVFALYEVKLWQRALLFIPIFILIFAGVRSSVGHRPANPSDAIFSDNRLLNELAKNSIHNVIYAAYSRAAHDGSAKKYGTMDIDEALQRVGRRLNIPTTGDVPFMRRVESQFTDNIGANGRKKNLVIFLQESVGAQFVEAIGGEPGITPNLNALSKDGLLFARLYSNGTRSIRGISGTVAGFLATPGLGVVKRNLSQSGFFTVASLLKAHGYRSSFFYGGESRFDNMKSWFFGNGFEEIHDQPTFKDPGFVGTWGVSDEVLVEKASQIYADWNTEPQPFVSVMFSTTNHSPFDFPDGKIELVPGVPKKSDINAIKFADFAIGKFIELAKEKGFYDDTVIMIIADHNVRVYGDDIIPVDTFRVPGLILGGSVPVGRVEQPVSQPDALATALDLLGLDLEYPILGNSVFSDAHAGVTLLQFHELYGLRSGDEIAIIQPDNAPATYKVSDKDTLSVTVHNPELEQDALAFVIVLDHLYRQQLYRVPQL